MKLVYVAVVKEVYTNDGSETGAVDVRVFESKDDAATFAEASDVETTVILSPIQGGC